MAVSRLCDCHVFTGGLSHEERSSTKMDYSMVEIGKLIGDSHPRSGYCFQSKFEASGVGVYPG